MTVTRWPHAVQREICPSRFVPVPPPCGCVQSRSVSSRMCRGRWIGRSYPTAAFPTLARVFAPRHLLAVLAPAALAAPSSAFAQGAGDDQYQDPFAAAPKTTKSPPAASNQRAQTGQPSLSNQPPATTNTAPSQSQQSAPAAASSPSAQAAPAAGSQLPYTGYEIPGMALMGLGLFGVGIGLRLRTLDETLY